MGIFCVAFCINGMWEEILVDDFFPVNQWTDQPAFNHSKEREIWVMLLEKAWAKVHGGYSNINSGLTREALHDLTGAPCTTYFNDTEEYANQPDYVPSDKRWEIIFSSDKNDYIMTAGTNDLSGNGTDIMDEVLGIVGNHAYSLLAAVELVEERPGHWKILSPEDNAYGKKIQRLVKLRNPWGKGEWKGDWSDKDSRWTHSLLKELNYETGDNGIFYMPFEEFDKIFSDFQVCFYHDDYKYSCIRMEETVKHHHYYFKIDIKEEGVYYFTLNQINKRFYPKTDKYEYSSCTMTVGRVEGDDKIIYVGAVQKEDKEAWFEANCTPGTYYVSVYTPWISFVSEFTLGIYGPKEILISEVTNNSIPKDFYKKLVASKAEANDSDWKNFAVQGHTDIKYKFEHSNDGFGYFFFKNDSEDTDYQCTLEFTAHKNLMALEPYTFRNPILSVGPQESECFVYFMIQRPSNIGYRIMSTFRKSAKQIKHHVKGQGQKFVRKYMGKDVGICAYGMKHKKGVVWEWENASVGYALKENITFH